MLFALSSKNHSSDLLVNTIKYNALEGVVDFRMVVFHCNHSAKPKDMKTLCIPILSMKEHEKVNAFIL